MQTFNHHFGKVVIDGDAIITLHEVGTRSENRKKIQQMIDYLILEMFIPSGNYKVLLSNDNPENMLEERIENENS